MDIVYTVSVASKTQAKKLIKDKEAMKAMWKVLDPTDSGSTDFKQVVTFVQAAAADTENPHGGFFKGLTERRAIVEAYRFTLGKGDDASILRKEFPALLRNLFFFKTIWGIYAKIDKDGDKKLDKDEFNMALEALAPELSTAERAEELKKVDLNQKGTITFNEFAIYAVKLLCMEDVAAL
eukprot:Platyproteum_vivax@DN8577_c0_g1_i1.p1